MNQMDRIFLRKRALDLLDRGYNSDINCVKLNAHSTWEHELKKVELCWAILKENGAFITECNFKTGGRADVISITDDGIIIYEIVKSESEASLKAKAEKYPKGIKFEIVRC